MFTAAKRKRRIPSERNRRIWEQVVLHDREQQEVAREFHITQQRVSQIIDHFHAWLAEQLPAGSEQFSQEEQLRLGLSTAYLRQQHLYGQAMRDSDASWQDKHAEKIRYGADDQVLWRETLRANQCGKVGYLSAAMRAAQNVLKIVQMASGHLSRAMEISPWLPGDVSDRSGRFQTGMAPPTPVSQVLCGAAVSAAGGDEKVLCESADDDVQELELSQPVVAAAAPNPCAAGPAPAERACAKVLCGDRSPGCASPPAELIAAGQSGDDMQAGIESLAQPTQPCAKPTLSRGGDYGFLFSDSPDAQSAKAIQSPNRLPDNRHREEEPVRASQSHRQRIRVAHASVGTVEKLPPAATPLPLLDDLLAKSCEPSVDRMIHAFARRREDRERVQGSGQPATL